MRIPSFCYMLKWIKFICFLSFNCQTIHAIFVVEVFCQAIEFCILKSLLAINFCLKRIQQLHCLCPCTVILRYLDFHWIS